MHENLLILSAGRRAFLTQCFQREFARASRDGQVIAADLAPQLSPACQVADKSVATPPIGDPQYIDRLIDLCRQHRVRVVIPTIDTDLLLLAQHRERFRDVGAEMLVSDPQLVRRCRDKRLTVELFAAYGIGSANQVDPSREDSYPLIARPYDGSSSQNIHIVKRRADLPAKLLDDPKLLFCEYLSPDEHDEYTVDMYFDRSSRLTCLVPRRRLATRAGEVSKAMTVRGELFDGLRQRFATLPGARGCLTLQLFVRRHDAALFGIEINPRFGGGYPLTYEAGGNFPAWIIAEYFDNARIDEFVGWEDHLTMLRYDAHVLVRGAA